MSKPGTVYLLHFSEAYKHARHYMGYASDLEERLSRHRSGQGARLLSVLKASGIGWECVRTWRGSRALERKLKNFKNAPTLCPVCSGSSANKRAKAVK